MGYSIRTPTLRFTWWVYFNKKLSPNWNSRAEEELYDYATDPQGNVNVASDGNYRAQIDALKTKIVKEITGTCGKCPWKPV